MDGGHKEVFLEFRHFVVNISRSGSEVAAVVPAAIALVLLIALVPGYLSLFLSLQQLVESFLYAASHQILELLLDNSSFSFIISSAMVHDFILLEFCKSYFFSSIFNLRNLYYFILKYSIHDQHPMFVLLSIICAGTVLD